MKDLLAKYETVIGLEIHAELATKSKMFCGSDNHSPLDEPPNLHTCEVCAGEPGTLPVLNQKAIEWTIMTGLALNSKIAEKTKWDRKQYFYPDLPKGYQISQYEQPLTYEGKLAISDGDGKEREITVTRIHLEEDTGKLTHPEGKPYSLVDLNRAGTPLMELVTEPEIKTSGEAKRFAQEYQRVLRTIGVSTADMEKGEMRVEANVSVREKGARDLGTKVEIKNISSFKSVERAIEYEIKRQVEVIEEGGRVVQETRGWSEAKGKTFSQRVKETADDYRYFAEPDLPEVVIDDRLLNKIKVALNTRTLPAERRKTLLKMGLLLSEANALIDNPKLADLFDETARKLGAALSKKIAGLILTELVGYANSVKKDPEDFAFTSEQFSELSKEVLVSGAMTSTIAKSVIPEMFENGKSHVQVLEEMGLSQVSDEAELDGIVDKVVNGNDKAVADYKAGKEAAFEFLFGRAMTETRSQANPKVLRELLKKKLSS